MPASCLATPHLEAWPEGRAAAALAEATAAALAADAARAGGLAERALARKLAQPLDGLRKC